MRIKRTKKRITIIIYQRQSDIVDKIMQEEELSDRIRELLNEYGEKRWPAIPAYAEAAKLRAEMAAKTTKEKKEWEELKPEDYAVNTLKAKIVNGEACFMVPAGLRFVPMSDIKEFTLESEWVKMHNGILNHDYVQLDGRRWQEYEYEAHIKEWNEVK